jgi:hypothetical protein
MRVASGGVGGCGGGAAMAGWPDIRRRS